jgi:hypothetical protein
MLKRASVSFSGASGKLNERFQKCGGDAPQERAAA